MDMTIGDIYKNHRCGRNIEELPDNNEQGVLVDVIDKDAIQNSVLIPSRFRKERYPYDELDQIHFVHKGDIVFRTKPPYKAALCINEPSTPIYIPKHFIAIKDINEDYVDLTFLTNYLNLKELKEVEESTPRVKDGKKIKIDLSLDAIDCLKLPKVPVEKQREVSRMMSLLNDRAKTYIEIIDNDEKLIEKAMREIAGVELCMKK